MKNVFYGFGIYDSDDSEDDSDSEDSSDDDSGGQAMEVNLMTNQNYFSNNSNPFSSNRFGFARQPLTFQQRFGGYPGFVQ